MSKRIGDPQRRWVDRLRKQRVGAVMDKPAAKPSGPPPQGKPCSDVTDQMVQRGARALTEQYGRVGILGRALDYRHPGPEGIARTVLAAALDDQREAPEGGNEGPHV